METGAARYFPCARLVRGAPEGTGMVVFRLVLVAAIFMHLAAEKRLIYRVLIFTGFFVLGLFWLTYLAWYDPIHR